MLNALSSHSKLSSTTPSNKLLSCSPLPTTTATITAPTSGNKMNLSGNQQVSNLGLNLNLSTSDSSSGGSGGAGGISLTMGNTHSHNSINSNNHHSHRHNSLGNFHAQHQQYQQQQQQLAGQQVESIEANKGYTFEEQFKQLYELSDDPKRKEFLDDLFQFMADRNQPVNRIPIMAKQVLDLYELYNLVVARGGLVEVINKKIWREITKGLNLPSSITSAAFTLRTQYMKYLYPYECAKNNFSQQDELQQAIDGNRREGRRAGATGMAGYAPYLSSAGSTHGADPNQLLGSGHYSASPSPNHLFASHNLLSQAQQLAASHQHQQSQLQPLQLHHQEPREPQRPQSSRSSNASPSASFNQQRLYQDSIESDHEDEGSIDLGHSSKRNSPIDHEHQHLDPHNHHLSQQQAAAEQQQQLAAAAAALRQQLGAAISFAGSQNFLGQLTSQLPTAAAVAAAAAAAQPGNLTSNPNQTTNNNNSGNSVQGTCGIIGAGGQGAEVLKQQQEQFLAALMAAANQQQQQQQQQPQQRPPTQSTPQQQQQQACQAQLANGGQEQQAAARAALSMMASNAMLIAASNAPDAMAVATAAQAIGVKGAFIILLL